MHGLEVCPRVCIAALILLMPETYLPPNATHCLTKSAQPRRMSDGVRLDTGADFVGIQ
jgi:hypothetical protein